MNKLLAFALILSALTRVGSAFLNYKKTHPNIPEQNHATQSIESTAGIIDEDSPIGNAIRLTGDSYGQFHSTITINGVEMPCLIDTGAGITAVPMDMARRARLEIGGLGMASTANGLAATIESGAEVIEFGGNEILNTRVSVLQNLDETLVGMNVLRKFEVSTRNNVMTLTPIDKGIITAYSDADEEKKEKSGQAGLPRKKASEWKKTQVCDEGGYCKTVYSR